MELEILQFFVFFILYFSIPYIFYMFFVNIKNQLSFNKRAKKQTNKLQLNYIEKTNLYRKYGLSTYSKKNTIRALFIVFSIIPAAVSLVSLVVAIPLVIILPYLFIFINRTLIKREYDEKENTIDRILTFKRKEMGLIDTESNKYNYNAEFEILEWHTVKDINKIKLFLPVTFDPLYKDLFLEKFSTQFGDGRPFEIDNTDEKIKGWDTGIGQVILTAQKPLPTMATWDKRYLEDPTIQWSFFPLGISSKGGVPLINPETGEEERIVGFDLTGDQRKYCDKNKLHVDSDITASPMTLIAGGNKFSKLYYKENSHVYCRNIVSIITGVKRFEILKSYN